MNHLPQNWMRLWLAFAVLSGFLAITFSTNAQVPVITVPPDFNVAGTNEAFASGIWRTKASMPTRRDDFSISQINGKIYVAGGKLDYFNPQYVCAPTNTLEEYDPATDTWTPGLAQMPTARLFAGAGTVSGKMYVVGGQGPNGCGAAIPTVEAYDPSSNQWTTKQNMHTARHSMGVAILHDPTLNRDILYAIGGAENTGNGTDVPVNTVEAYDPVTNTWTTKTPMRQERFGPVVGVVNGKIYAIGGFDRNYTPGSDQTVEEYDPATNAWTFKADMPTARGRHPAGGVLNNLIYVAGGVDFLFPLAVSTVEAYNPSTNVWSRKPDMLTARTNLGVAIVHNTLYAIGGFQVETATVGQPFIYQITATNYPTSYNLNCLPQCPGGLNIDPTTGVIYGVPTDADVGLYGLLLSAANGSGTGYAVTAILVLPSPTPAPSPPPVIVSNNCATGRTGRPFTFQVLTKNASSAARFTATGLPYQNGVGPELTIDPVTGLISGTPTFDGSFGVALTVTDGSAITHGTLQLTFISDPTIPIINGGSSAILVPGQFFTKRLTADASNPTFSYIGTDGREYQGPTSAGLPPGLSFDGVDTIAGTYNPPDTIKIRPLFAIQPIANNSNGTGVAPLNFIEPPTPTTNAATLVASFSARLNGSVNPVGYATTIYFQYGTTNTYGITTTPQHRTGNTYQNISADINSLRANTTYHFRIVATNSAATTFGSDKMFTTLSPTGPPVVTSNPASNKTSSSATLNGSLDPHGLTTNVYFQYGLTTGYGHHTAMQSQAGDTYRNIVATISGLNASTTYHFRIVATNQSGMMRGSDRTFTTPPSTPACLWMVKSPVPYNARGIFAVSDGTYVYCGGGYDGTNTHSDLLRYDPVANSWASLAPSADTHYLSPAVFYSGKIYNMGGFPRPNTAPTSTTRIYNIATNIWTIGAPMPAALTDMATILWNGIIYVAGGSNGSGAVNTLYAYNIATNTWSTLPPMPAALYLPAFGAINGKLYVASGNDGTSELNTLYIYDIASNTWTTGANVPTAVTGPGSTVFCGKLYLYGGGYPTPRNITQIYDPVTNSWSNGPNLNVSRLKFYGSAVGNNSIVAPGGSQAPIPPETPGNTNEQLVGCTCP